MIRNGAICWFHAARSAANGSAAETVVAARRKQSRRRCRMTRILARRRVRLRASTVLFPFPMRGKPAGGALLKKQGAGGYLSARFQRACADGRSFPVQEH